MSSTDTSTLPDGYESSHSLLSNSLNTAASFGTSRSYDLAFGSHSDLTDFHSPRNSEDDDSTASADQEDSTMANKDDGKPAGNEDNEVTVVEATPTKKIRTSQTTPKMASRLASPPFFDKMDASKEGKDKKKPGNLNWIECCGVGEAAVEKAFPKDPTHYSKDATWFEIADMMIFLVAWFNYFKLKDWVIKNSVLTGSSGCMALRSEDVLEKNFVVLVLFIFAFGRNEKFNSYTTLNAIKESEDKEVADLYRQRIFPLMDILLNVVVKGNSIISEKELLTTVISEIPTAINKRLKNDGVVSMKFIDSIRNDIDCFDHKMLKGILLQSAIGFSFLLKGVKAKINEHKNYITADQVDLWDKNEVKKALKGKGKIAALFY